MRLTALFLVLALFSELPASRLFAHDDVDADKTVAQQLMELKESMLRTRDNRVLYVSQIKSRFGEKIESIAIHTGLDVDARRYSDLAWLVINFKDGSKAMVVANMGLQSVERVIALSAAERGEVDGITPVPKGNDIQPKKQKATAYQVKNVDRLLDVLADYRLNMGTVSSLDGLIVGNLEFVPNVNRPGTRTAPPAHNPFQQRLREQGGQNRQQEPQRPRAPRR